MIHAKTQACLAIYNAGPYAKNYTLSANPTVI